MARVERQTSNSGPWQCFHSLGFLSRSWFLFKLDLGFFENLGFFLLHENPFCPVVSTTIETNSLITYHFLSKPCNLT